MTTTTCPTPYSSLRKSTKSGRYYVETVFTSEDFGTLKAWWKANGDRMRKAGAKLGGWAPGPGVTRGRMFYSFDRSTSGTYSDIRHQMRIFYTVEDQAAAAAIEKKNLLGSYATYRSRHSYREDIRALTALPGWCDHEEVGDLEAREAYSRATMAG